MSNHHHRIKTYLPVLAGLLLAINLAACQNFLEVVTQAGDDGLVWPLPPTPARLIYEEQIDINQTMSAYIGLATGSGQNIQMIRPYRVAADKDLIAVVDQDRGSAYVIDRYRNTVTALKYNNDSNGGSLTAVRDVAIDDMKRIYLLDSLKGQVVVFQDNGRFIRQFGAAILWSKPDRLAVDAIRQRIYIADSFQGRVYVFSLSGVFLYMFGEQGKDQGRFSGLSDLTVDMDGNLYILEASTRRIQKFDPHGAWLQVIHLDKEYFREPVAIGVEESDVIYVADRDRSQVVILDNTGKHILSLGALGWGRGKFVDLTDISFDQSRQRLFTSEAGSSRLQVFRRTPEDWLPFP